MDPVLLQIPTYFDIIPKKDARDLRTIRGKLEADKYISKEAWEADIQLMADNAIKFNGAESEVGLLGVKLLQRSRELLTSVGTQPQGKKRQAPETNEANKKQKTGWYDYGDEFLESGEFLFSRVSSAFIQVHGYIFTRKFAVRGW